MKNADWREYRTLGRTITMKNHQTTSDKTPSGRRLYDGKAEKPFDSWMREVSAAADAYVKADNRVQTGEALASAHSITLAKDREAKENALRQVVALLRERCGDELVAGLAALGVEVTPTAIAEFANHEWRPDDVVELADGDGSGVDLDAAEREESPDAT